MILRSAEVARQPRILAFEIVYSELRSAINSEQLGGDTGLVLAMQMTRMFLILFLSPWLIDLWLKSEQSRDRTPKTPSQAKV
jgi:hypothetical protein